MQTREKMVLLQPTSTLSRLGRQSSNCTEHASSSRQQLQYKQYKLTPSKRLITINHYKKKPS